MHMLGSAFPAFLSSQTVGVTISKLGKILLECFARSLKIQRDNHVNRNKENSTLCTIKKI